MAMESLLRRLGELIGRIENRPGPANRTTGLLSQPMGGRPFAVATPHPGIRGPAGQKDLRATDQPFDLGDLLYATSSVDWLDHLWIE